MANAAEHPALNPYAAHAAAMQALAQDANCACSFTGSRGTIKTGLADRPTLLPTWAGGKPSRKEPCCCEAGERHRARKAAQHAEAYDAERVA